MISTQYYFSGQLQRTNLRRHSFMKPMRNGRFCLTHTVMILQSKYVVCIFFIVFNIISNNRSLIYTNVCIVDLYTFHWRNGWFRTKLSTLLGPPCRESIFFSQTHLHYRGCAATFNPSKKVYIRRWATSRNI